MSPTSPTHKLGYKYENYNNNDESYVFFYINDNVYAKCQDNWLRS